MPSLPSLSVVATFWFVLPVSIFGFHVVRPSSSALLSSRRRYQQASSSSSSRLFLRTNIQVPILDVVDKQQREDSTSSKYQDKDSKEDVVICPLPSSHLPDEIATPFLFGMTLDLPVHKLLIEEATEGKTEFAITLDGKGGGGNDLPPMYGHLIWKNPMGDDPLIGAIGCTAQILVNAPTPEVVSEQVAKDIEIAAEKGDNNNKDAAIPSETPSNTVLCRGGFRFVIKEVIKTIPYPVAIVDEIEDDDDVGDDDMFSSVGSADADNEDNEDDDDEDDKYNDMSTPELIKDIMEGVQFVINGKLDKVNEKGAMSPLEKSILEDSGVNPGIDPNMIERMQVEEMAASWDVFQAALVDDIEPKDRKFAVAIMAVELADMKNSIRQQVTLSRNGDERLRIVLRELDEIVGMARARKLATQITDDADDDSRDLQIGAPTLPPWAKTIRKGSRVEYFWNEDYGWVAGEVIEDPVTVVDEILLTIRFDDGELHKIPLSADEKVRWRPG